MANVIVDFEEQNGKIKPFVPARTDLKFTVSSSADGPYWVECMVEAPKALSLAPRGELDKARMMIGIVGKGEKLSKEVRLFASSTTYPEVYNIKLTFLVYDREATVAERLEYTREIECGDADAKVL